MNAVIPRLRVFAGPNGSGKSTFKDDLPATWLGVYINADEIEKHVRELGSLCLTDFDITASHEELQTFLNQSTLLAKENLLSDAAQLQLIDGAVQFGTVAPNSYFASVLADFIRHKLLAAQMSFTFETVMSYRDKARSGRADGMSPVSPPTPPDMRFSASGG